MDFPLFQLHGWDKRSAFRRRRLIQRFSKYYISFLPISQPLKRNFFKKGWYFLKVVGIICEYNPLHLGHEKQLHRVRQLYGEDCAIVCAMSGNFVQRGAPAILDKSLRAKAAVQCGADLVLELPVTTSLSSAEGFAAGGVAILARMCSVLCFGAETPDPGALNAAAQALLDSRFPELLRRQLKQGISFPAARQRALEQLGAPWEILSQPNNILAVEYCKAILSQNAPMTPLPILREGSYHDPVPQAANPSATALRERMLAAAPWEAYVPAPAREAFTSAPLHAIQAGERAILSRLRAMEEADFQALPYGSEGLWRKLMHASRREAALEQILTAVKSKRYTRSRLDRMVMCAFLGITEPMLRQSIPYIRVLAFSGRGRLLLRRERESAFFRNAGQPSRDPYWLLENRWEDLYGLFCIREPEPPGAEGRRRIYCAPELQPTNSIEMLSFQ